MSIAPGRTRSVEQLQGLADEGARTLAGATAEAIIEWARETFGSRVAVASSMQDAVLPALVAGVAPGTDVLFLDTGYHFSETLATRDEVAARYPLNVRSLRPEQTVAQQDEAYGPDLFASNPDLCCMLRKTTPLFEALEGYEAWMTGLRRAESASRAGAPEVSFDAKHGLVKISPIVAWSDEQVEEYARLTGAPRNPLLLQGYPSIGCAPCTRRVAPGADPRSGRWAGTSKTECGIHA